MAMPVYVFWKEFLEVFPEAKVVHYPREVEAWQRSSQVQLKELIKVKRFPDEISYFFMRFFAPETYRCHLWQDRCNKLIVGQEFDGFYTLKNGRMQADQLLNGVRYRTHNADVELNCPKEKILVLSKTTVRSCNCLKVLFGKDLSSFFAQQTLPSTPPSPYLQLGNDLRLCRQTHPYRRPRPTHRVSPRQQSWSLCQRRLQES